MADGSAMNRVEAPAGVSFPLEEAIARLEAGDWPAGAVAEVGRVLLRADGPMGEAGLLQRLRGHARLLVLREGGAAPDGAMQGRKPAVRDDVKAMLDAVRQAR